MIKRIIANMREGGVSRFVIVIGHQAYSVMDCLDGVDGVIYAYQKEQKGTGHAALCGLKALSTMGYTGPVIVSMGDKIISKDVIAGIIRKSQSAEAVFGVQPIRANFSGGRVVVDGDKPYGIVEFADAALMALADVSEDDYDAKLKAIGLNAKKAEKVRKKALGSKPSGTKELCGRVFGADEVLNTKYANAGLYCFDVNEAIRAIGNVGADNAQGEIYLTDTLEYFASKNEAVLYEVKSADDMLTYSTKPELRKMSRKFMRKASEYIIDIKDGKLDAVFNELYPDNAESQKQRYIKVIELFKKKYGDAEVVITRSPGRVNLMGRHIDHRGGGNITDREFIDTIGRLTELAVKISNSRNGLMYASAVSATLPIEIIVKVGK